MSFSLITSAKVPVTASNTGGTSSAVDTTGADLFVAYVAYNSSSGAPTFSDSEGNTWTAATLGGSNPAQRFYYCVNPTTSASHTFTVSSAVSTVCNFTLLAFSGVNTSDAYEADVNVSGRDTGNVTSTEDGSLYVFASSHNESWQISSVTYGSVQETDARNAGYDYLNQIGYYENATAGDLDFHFIYAGNDSFTPQNCRVSAIVFNPAGGGGVSQELTGNSSASAIGTLGVSAEANVSVTPTGVAGSSAVGTLGVTAEINASAELSGIAATSAIGTLTAEVGGGTTAALSGVDGTATVGTLAAAGQINEFVDLLGNSATGAVGTLIVVTGLQVALSGNAATGAVGTLGVTAEVNASATLTGVGSSGAVGTLEITVPIAVFVELTDVEATGAIGTLAAVGAGQVWTEITPVSTIWTEIS